jgi:hypothetical protein
MSENFTRKGDGRWVSDTDRFQEELTTFIAKNHYSREETEEAYYRVCGVFDDTEVDPRVAELVEVMTRIVAAGYPLNRISAYIITLEHSGKGVEEFQKYIDSLHVSDREKVVLRSIILKERSGVLMLHGPEGQVLHEQSIRFDAHTSIDKYARELKQVFEKMVQQNPHTRMSISFSER